MSWQWTYHHLQSLRASLVIAATTTTFLTRKALGKSWGLFYFFKRQSLASLPSYGSLFLTEAFVEGCYLDSLVHCQFFKFFLILISLQLSVSLFLKAKEPIARSESIWLSPFHTCWNHSQKRRETVMTGLLQWNIGTPWNRLNRTLTNPLLLENSGP